MKVKVNVRKAESIDTLESITLDYSSFRAFRDTNDIYLKYKGNNYIYDSHVLLNDETTNKAPKKAPDMPQGKELKKAIGRFLRAKKDTKCHAKACFGIGWHFGYCSYHFTGLKNRLKKRGIAWKDFVKYLEKKGIHKGY